MTMLMKDKQNKIDKDLKGTEGRSQITELKSLEDIESSVLFEDFREKIRIWRKTFNFLDLQTCAGEFRTYARQKGFNLASKTAELFIDIYWELV